MKRLFSFCIALAALLCSTWANGMANETARAEDSIAHAHAGLHDLPWQYNPLKGFRSTKTRQQVVAEYVAARAEVAALNSDDRGSAYLAQKPRSNDGSTLAGQPKVAH